MKVKVACIQPNIGADIIENIRQTENLIRKARKDGAKLITTPECAALMLGNVTFDYRLKFLNQDLEYQKSMQKLAKELGCWILIGSIAIQQKGKKRLSNRAIMINDKGKVAGFYDKIHMFDAELANGEIYKESSRFEPSNKAKLVKTPWGMLGMTICYDVRFPHLFRALAKGGAKIITVPAAFVYYTGKSHWHTLLRARAIENGCYIIAPGQTGEHPGNRRTYGHSLIIDPWGNIMEDAGDKVGYIVAEIDMNEPDRVRKTLPCLTHDRAFKLEKSE